MRIITSLATCVCLVVSLLLAPYQTSRAQAAKTTARLLHTITDAYSYIWSSDSRTLAVYDVDLDVALYDADTGQMRAHIKYEGPPTPNGLYFTPDGQTLVIHSDRVRLYSASDGKLIRQFAEGTKPVNYYEKYYKTEVVSGYDSDGQYKYEQKPPDNLEKTRELPTEYISDRVVSPDGKTLLTRVKGGVAQVYEVGTGALKFTLEPYVAPGKKKNKRAVVLGEFSPDGRFIVTSHADPTPRLWKATTGELVADLAPQSGTVSGVRFSPDSRYVATTSFYDGIVKVWDTATGKLRHTVGSKKDGQWFAVWNPRNSTFVTKSPKTDKWEINIWSAETGALVSKLDGTALKEKFDENLTFEYSPDGRILVTKAKNIATLKSVLLGKDKPRLIAHLWNAETGALITSLPDTKGRGADAYWYDKFIWIPSGDVVLTAGATVKLWNRRGELVQDIDANAMRGASLSPDGKLLVVTGEPTDSLLSLGVAVAKTIVGKRPKEIWPKTYIWKLEG
jgi:WD40 repeat protein